MITVYGSVICPDTLSALSQLAALGCHPNFVNVTGSIALLKEFLYLRDTSDLFDKVRGHGGVGIPAFKLPDGSFTLNVDFALEAARTESARD